MRTVVAVRIPFAANFGLMSANPKERKKTGEGEKEKKKKKTGREL